MPARGFEPPRVAPLRSERSASSKFHHAGMVPRTGIEPAQPFGHQPLKLARLPVPPPGRCRGERTRTAGLSVPNRALYSTELHPGEPLAPTSRGSGSAACGGSEQAAGVEPALSAWEANRLPLTYACMLSGRRGSNPPRRAWKAPVAPCDFTRTRSGRGESDPHLSVGNATSYHWTTAACCGSGRSRTCSTRRPSG